MSDDNDAKVKQAMRAYRAGDKDGAYSLLMDVTDDDPQNKKAWVVLSRVVTNDAELRVCLENILFLDPENEDAQARLDELGDPEDDDDVDDLLEDDVDFEDKFVSAFDTSEHEEVRDDEESDLDFDFEGDDFDDEDDDFDDEDFDDEEDDAPASQRKSPLSPLEDDFGDDEFDDDDFDDEDEAIVSDDPFYVIPTAIKATRVPGASEKYPGWVIPTVAVLALLNIGALAMLLMGLG